MRKQGKIVRWDDEKGYGFIIPEEGGEDIFLHISAYESKYPRPNDDDVVTFIVVKEKDDRLRAENVLRRHEKWQQQIRPRSRIARLVIVALFAVTLLLFVNLGRLPEITLLVYLIMSLVSFMAYAIDKSAAEKKRWRTAEITLHLLDLLCGWPGGLLAQNLLRHKVSKLSFQINTVFMIIFNCLILTGIFLPRGDTIFQATRQKLEETLEKLPVPEFEEEHRLESEDENHGIQIIPQ